MTAILSRYPEAVVAKVCDPRFGLPSICRFLPTLAEISEACEREDGRIRRALEADARRAEQMASERQRQAEKLVPGYNATQARRREVVRQWRETFAAQHAASDPRSVDQADARRAFGAEQREAVSAVIMASLQAKVELQRQTPCALSDAARATLGMPPLTSQPRRVEAAE